MSDKQSSSSSTQLLLKANIQARPNSASLPSCRCSCMHVHVFPLRCHLFAARRSDSCRTGHQAEEKSNLIGESVTHRSISYSREDRFSPARKNGHKQMMMVASGAAASQADFFSSIYTATVCKCDFEYLVVCIHREDFGNGPCPDWEEVSPLGKGKDRATFPETTLNSPCLPPSSSHACLALLD